MKFTLEWLKEYCPCDLKPSELAELLTGHGLKVESYHTVGNDAVFELEVTANRPDWLSILGVAREVALLTGTRVKIPVVQVRWAHCKKEEKGKIKPAQICRSGGDERKSFIQVDEPELCPLYIGRVIKGIKVSHSPNWLKERLEAIGLRAVNNIVDITNYVLYETGQPLHTFDLSRLSERRVVVRRAKAGEKIKAIDDKEYSLSPEMLVIADAASPVAIAGVMGGKSSEICIGTTDILLESAIFNQSNIRKTSRALKLFSDSSYRFERGINPEGVELASLRAISLIKELAGGEVTAQQEVSFIKPKTQKITFRISRNEDLLGLAIDKTEIKRILKGLGFVIKKEYKGIMDLVVPPFRQDITREIDITEEVIRIIGYDKVPTVIPAITPNLFVQHKIDSVNERIKQLLAGCGYSEVLTNSFLEEKYLDDFPLWPARRSPDGHRDAGGSGDKSTPHGIPLQGIGLLNPEGMEDRYLRKSLLPGLLVIQRINQGYSELCDKPDIFEIAKNYYRDNGKPQERFLLALLDSKGLYSLKGTLTKIFNEIGLTFSIEMKPFDISCFAAGRGIQIKVNDDVLGWFGELTDGLADKYEFKTKPVLVELDFELLTKYANLGKTFKNFSRFPSIKRDLAMVFNRETQWQEIEKVVRRDIPDLLEEVKFFDLYQGENIPSDKKSMAFSLIFRSFSRTLTNAEIDEAVKGVIKRLEEKFKATLRV